jgi:ribonuclease R
MTPRLPTRREVLELLGSEARPLHAREIAARLRVSEVDYLGLQRLLDDLSFEGVLAARPGQRFKLSRQTAGARGSDREGLLSVHARGFGFVASLGDSGDDVFVPPGAMGGAMHGDRVRVRITSRRARGAEGEVVAVLERGLRRIAGTLRRKGKSSVVEPDDARVKGPIVLSSPSARPPGRKEGAEGDAVVVAITRWPESPDENPEGEIESILGRPGELAVETAKILVLEGVQEGHSSNAIQEAEGFGDRIPPSMDVGREDLRKIPLPTIDPEDARDHDDAVWVERTERGYRAWIAIADVSMFVSPGTSLDDEAQDRGCSVYLPDRAIAMLPGALSSNLCSLLPGVDRLCLCVEADIDPAGSVRASRLVRGVMRSRAKLTYEGVARALGLSSEARGGRDVPDELVDGLRTAYELSRVLRSRRMKRGAIDFELPEARVVFHEETREPIDVTRRGQDPGVKRAYQLIEELMLLANETVARWCEERDVPTIYRVHGPPDEQKLDRFSAMCTALGIAFDLEDTRDPKRLADLLASFSEHPLAPVLNSLLLRSMKQATYDVTNIGHFGLASKAYLHFTSPIRRYPDLVVHRIVHRELSAQGSQRESGEERDRLAEAALSSSIAERRAMDVERAIIDLYRAFMMKDRIGARLEGTVTAVVGAGIFAQLDAPFVDVLVRLEDLGPDHWEVDDEMLRVVAARSGNVIALGDRIGVEIYDVSILRRTVYAKRVSSDANLPARREKRRNAKPEKHKGQTVKSQKVKPRPKSPQRKGRRR